MKKQILSIGKVLSRVEQKQVFGGSIYDEDEGSGSGCKSCRKNSDCASTVCVNWGGDCSGPCGCGMFCI